MIGYYVVPHDKQRLRSGGSVYDVAVCVSATPLLLVSLETDMLWSQVGRHEVFALAPAPQDIVDKCRERAVRDGVLPPIPATTYEAKVDTLQSAADRTKKEALLDDLAAVLNKHCVENRSNTPDFVLAEFLIGCLEAFAPAVNARECWYGRKPQLITGDVAVPPDPENLSEKVQRLLSASGLTAEDIGKADLIYSLDENGTALVVYDRLGKKGFVSYADLRARITAIETDGQVISSQRIFQLVDGKLAAKPPFNETPSERKMRLLTTCGLELKQIHTAFLVYMLEEDGQSALVFKNRCGLEGFYAYEKLAMAIEENMALTNPVPASERIIKLPYRP